MEEKKRILGMVEQGKISPQEAEKLLSALDLKQNKASENSKLKIQISNEDKNNIILNVGIPLELIKLGLKFLPDPEDLQADVGNTNFDLSRVNWQEILEMAAAGITDDLFYMDYREDDGTLSTINIFVE